MVVALVFEVLKLESNGCSLLSLVVEKMIRRLTMKFKCCMNYDWIMVNTLIHTSKNKDVEFE